MNSDTQAISHSSTDANADDDYFSDEAFIKAVEDANNQLPKEVDEYTSLAACSFYNGVFKYAYVVKMSVKDYDFKGVRRLIQKNIAKDTSLNVLARALAKRGYSMSFQYTDIYDGKKVITFTAKQLDKIVN